MKPPLPLLKGAFATGLALVLIGVLYLFLDRSSVAVAGLSVICAGIGFTGMSLAWLLERRQKG
jgi:hypothetical protein